MANRYWRGGTGTWDASNTANWSATSGGAGGASAPTLNDDVFFDAGSDAGGIFTVTIGGTSALPSLCRSLNVSSLDFATTFSLSATAYINVYGSLDLPISNLTWAGIIGSQVAFKSTTIGNIITTNGVALTNTRILFDGIGGEWTLGSALSNGTRELTINAGTFNTGNYNVTCGFFGIGTGNIKVVNLGSSIFTVNGNSGAWNIGTLLNLTFNAGTSEIVMAASSGSFGGNGLTYYNVSFVSTAAGTNTVAGANAFNNLSFSSAAATGIKNISVFANQTVNGTLTLGTANTAIRRMFMFSDVVGAPRTITANAIAALADVDFRDIVAAGASGTWAGTRLGNCLGNSNITFDAGKNVYRIGTGNWSATQWALSSGGAVNVNNFPLPQDNAIFDANTAAGTQTMDFGWQIGGMDFSALTAAVTMVHGAQNIYKNIVLGSFVTLSGGSFGYIFVGQGTTQQLTSAGKSGIVTVVVNNATGTLQLQDDLTTSGAFTLTSGTLDLNNNNLTALTFSSNNSNVRSIAFGTGSINTTGGGGTAFFEMSNLTNFSYTGVSAINLGYSGGVTSSINLGITGGTEANTMNVNLVAGTYSVNLGGRYLSVNFTGFAGTLQGIGRRIYGDIVYSTGMTLNAGVDTIFEKSSGTQTITTNGKTLDFPITKSGAGTLQLADNLTQGVTRTFTHTAGTIDLNDNDLNAGLWSSTGALARHLDTGATGELHIAGANFTASGSNLTTEGTGSISMDSASSKTFAGGGFSWPTINQGGAGDLNLTGANRFKDITNTVAPCAVVFPANVTTQVENFSLNGTPGNLVSIRSSVAGQRFGLDKVAA